MGCDNARFTDLRADFIHKLHEINHLFRYFDNHDILYTLLQ